MRRTHLTTHRCSRESHVIVRYGIFAGLIVSVSDDRYTDLHPRTRTDRTQHGALVHTSSCRSHSARGFVGTEQYRDRTLGGVIKFMPGFIVGLGISAVAGVFYAIAWEISMAFMKFDFSKFYANAIVEQARASGADAQGLAAAATQAAEFTRMYANPLFRVPMTFLEIFPVGILVSLISAALLRNSRVLPARAPAPSRC